MTDHDSREPGSRESGKRCEALILAVEVALDDWESRRVGVIPGGPTARLAADLRAALAAAPDPGTPLPLDAAWKEAEAALPEGWAINLLWGTILPGERWGANAGPWPSKPGDPQTFAGGDTPEAALQALAVRLQGKPGA